MKKTTFALLVVLIGISSSCVTDNGKNSFASSTGASVLLVSPDNAKSPTKQTVTIEKEIGYGIPYTFDTPSYGTNVGSQIKTSKTIETVTTEIGSNWQDA